MALVDELREKLEEASTMFYERDMAVVDILWSSGKFWLFGSEADQMYETRDNLHDRGLPDILYQTQ